MEKTTKWDISNVPPEHLWLTGGPAQARAWGSSRRRAMIARMTVKQSPLLNSGLISWVHFTLKVREPSKMNKWLLDGINKKERI